MRTALLKVLLSAGFTFLICLKTVGQNKIDALEIALKNTQTDTSRLRLYSEIASQYRTYRNYDKSIFYVNRGLRLSSKIKNYEYSSTFFLSIGVYLRFKKQLDSAIHYLILAQRNAKRYHQNRNIELAGYYLAVTYADRAFKNGSQSDHIASVGQLFENLRFSQKNNSEKDISYRNYGLLSAIYRDYGIDSLVYFYRKKELELNKKDNTPEDELFLLGSKLEISLYDKKPSQTKYYLNQILNFKDRKKLAGLYRYTLFELVSAYVKFGDYKTALYLANILKNNVQFSESMDQEWQMRLHVNLATIYLKQKNYQMAETAHKKAINFSKNIDVPFGVRFQMLTNQEKLLEKQNNFKEALILNRSLNQMQDSLFAIQNSFMLATSEERFRSRTIEQDLNQKLQINELRNEKNLIITLTSLILISVIAIAVLLTWQREKKNRKKLQLSLLKIETQNEELEKSNSTKDKLFSIIAHDLKSPVSDLHYFVKPFFKKHAESEEALKISQKLADLNTTMDNLLVWALQQSHGLSLQVQTENIRDLIIGVANSFESQLQAKKISLLTDLPSFTAQIDERKLEIVVRNLLSNAIKFTPESGFVKISCKPNQDNFEILVKDSGAGMNAEMLEKAKQGLSSTDGTKGEKGTGLGLLICKEFVTLHKGQLNITSTPNTGTTIQIILPLSS